MSVKTNTLEYFGGVECNDVECPNVDDVHPCEEEGCNEDAQQTIVEDGCAVYHLCDHHAIAVVAEVVSEAIRCGICGESPGAEMGEFVQPNGEHVFAHVQCGLNNDLPTA